MEAVVGGTPHFTFPKDVSVGGVRLLSSITPFHVDNRHSLNSLALQSPVLSPIVEKDEKKEVKNGEKAVSPDSMVVVDQEGGGSHDVKHISTTEAEIERARTDLQNRHINVKTIRRAQSLLRGQGGKKQKSKTKSKQSSKTKKKTNTKKSKAKSKKKAPKKKASKQKKKTAKKQTKKKKSGKK